MFFGKPSLQLSWSAICGSHCVLFFVCWKSKECSFGLKSCNWHDHLQMFCLEMCEGKSNIASWTRAQLLHISRTVIIYLHCDFFNGICLNVRAEYTVLYTISPLILINICIIFSMCQSLQFFWICQKSYTVINKHQRASSISQSCPNHNFIHHVWYYVVCFESSLTFI